MLDGVVPFCTKIKEKGTSYMKKRHMLNFTMLVHFEDHGVNQRPHVDLAGTHGFVEAAVLVGVKENEVRGAVVEFVSVQMMAVLPEFSHAPKSGANQDVNTAFFAADCHMRMATATFVISGCRTKLGFDDVPFSVSDVAVRIGIIRFTANEFRRNKFDNGCHNFCLFDG